MQIDKIRANILELCSESEYGSWEFWLTSPKDRTIEEAGQITQTISQLVKEKKIYPMEYRSVQDQSYKQTELDANRLKEQIMLSINPDNVHNSNDFYWFLATEEGKKEDQLLRE